MAISFVPGQKTPGWSITLARGHVIQVNKL
jgi:hypothetical protein